MAIFIGRRPETAFTRVPNEWARNPKLSLKAKGLLTYLLSHQDGYRLTVEQVVAEAADGKSAVYSALRELMERGYLRRVQGRTSEGKVGEVDYYVADSPAQTASGFTASGKPESGHDQGEQDETAGQTASRFSASGLTACGESTTKKTRVKKTKVLEDQNTISLSAPAGDRPSAEVAEPDREREVDASQEQPEPRNPIHRLLLEAGCPPENLDEVQGELTARFEPRSPKWWRTVAKEGDLPGLVVEVLEALQPITAPTHAAHVADAHPFTPKDDNPDDCQVCPFPVQNGRHKVGNQGGSYIAQVMKPGSNAQPEGHRRSTAALRAEQGLKVADELDRKFGHGRYAPGQIRSPADQRVADNQALYDHYKNLEESA